MDVSASSGVRRLANAAYVSLSGTLDDAFVLDRRVVGDASIVVFDFSEVRRITSFGVRKWIMALESLGPTECFFVRVPPVILGQFNMIAGFGAGGTVVSLYAPFLCSDCGGETNLLIDLRNDRRPLHGEPLPPPVCTHCSSVATEFDDVPEVFFSHVASRPRPWLPSAASRLLEGPGAPSGRRPLTVRKEMRQGMTMIQLEGCLDARQRFTRIFDGLEGDVLISCRGVDGETEEGVSAFVRALAESGARCFLSALPPSLLPYEAHLSAHPEQVSIASCLLPIDTSQTGPTYAEVSIARPFDHLADDPRVARDHEAALRLLSEVPPLVGEELRPKPSRAGLPDADQNVARMVLNRYMLVRPLARGGMGEIFLARQRYGAGFERDVIIKCLHIEHRERADMVNMFLREARLASMVSHPNVVTIYDFGREPDGYYLAMELVRGWDLATVLGVLARMGAPFPEAIACRILAQTCAGLSAAHEALGSEGQRVEIVHRGVSPQNILIMQSGQVKIADFGIAKVAEARSDTNPSLLKGKMPYMAPEQLLFNRRIDRRTDIFAAGAVFVECLAGSRAFPEGMPRTPTTALAVLSAAHPNLSAGLVSVVARALAADPEDRFQTAAEFEAALERLGADLGEAVSSTSISKWLGSLDLPALNTSRVSSQTLNARPRSTGEAVSTTMVEASEFEHATEVGTVLGRKSGAKE